MLQASFTPTSVRTPHALELGRLALLESRAVATLLLNRVRTTAATRLRGLLAKTRRRAIAEIRANLASEVTRQLGEAEAIYQNALAQAQSDCFKIITEVCREVLRNELQSNPDAIRARVESLCSSRQLAGSLIIVCHPRHESALRDHPSFGRLTVNSNPALPLGNIIIENSAGAMMFSWEDHLEAILARMRSKLSSRAVPNVAIPT